jgi:hypothetical protein
LGIGIDINSPQVLDGIIKILQVIKSKGRLVSDVIYELVDGFAMKKVIRLFIFTD